MSAWNPNDAVDVVALNRAAKRHTLRFQCSGRKRIEIIKCWIDNFNTGLDDPNHPHIMSNYILAGTGIPNMGYFPFFFDPTFTLYGNAQVLPYFDDTNYVFNAVNSAGEFINDWEESMLTYQQDNLIQDAMLYQAYGAPDLFYDYDIPYNVESGLITHPLALVNPLNADASPWTFPGYLTNSIRDNYRIKGVIRLMNHTMSLSTSDYMDVNILFRPVFIDNYSGKLNIEYWSYAPYFEDANYYGPDSLLNTPISDPYVTTQFKTMSIDLAGAINKTNISEMDQTNVEDIAQVEDINFENPYTSIVLQ